MLGFAFTFGWTPCIGPILTTVLAFAAASDKIGRGVLLLAAYSAGLAVPVLLTALGVSRFFKFYQSFRKYLHAVELFSGALLLFVGALVFVNKSLWGGTDGSCKRESRLQTCNQGDQPLPEFGLLLVWVDDFRFAR